MSFPTLEFDWASDPICSRHKSTFICSKPQSLLLILLSLDSTNCNFFMTHLLYRHNFPHKRIEIGFFRNSSNRFFCSRIPFESKICDDFVFTQLSMLFYDVKYHRTIILSDVDNGGSLPFFRDLWELKLLPQVMKVLEVITVLINEIFNVFIPQSIANSGLLGHCF